LKIEHEYGSIPHESDLDALSQDLLEIKFTNGLILDVGYYPEHNPAGNYHVNLFDGDWENRIGPWMCGTQEDTTALVEFLTQMILDETPPHE